MNLKIKLFLLLTGFQQLLFAQSGFTNLGGANFLGFGRAGATLTGIESIYMNQAGLTAVKDFSVDISAEKRFNFQELSTISIAGAKTFKFGTVGLLLSNFGFSAYNEQKFGLAYARKLNKNISFGGQFDFLRYNIESYGHKNLITFELGMQMRLSKELSLATHIFSPGHIGARTQTEIGSRIRFGLLYRPSEKVLLLTEIDKLISRAVEIKFGISYQFMDALQIRFGINPSANLYSFGAMFRLKNNYQISSAMAIHQNLGNSPAVSFQYNH